jgi:hypothetical protein
MSLGDGLDLRQRSGNLREERQLDYCSTRWSSPASFRGLVGFGYERTFVARDLVRRDVPDIDAIRSRLALLYFALMAGRLRL